VRRWPPSDLAAADLVWRSAKKGTHAQRNRASLSIGVFALTVACLLVATTLYFRKASYSEPEVAIYLAIVLIAAASAAALGSLLARAAKWVD
jgi:Tfp pilus assembly protein PilN